MAFKTGSEHHDSKLTTNEVKLIRATQLTLSNRYWANLLSVSDSAISLIRSNKTWNHI